jgi:hypothetical protein
LKNGVPREVDVALVSALDGRDVDDLVRALRTIIRVARVLGAPTPAVPRASNGRPLGAV